MNSKILKDRTKKFAHNCVRLSGNLPQNNLGWTIQKQLIRSSLSVAANYRAVCQSNTKPTFIAKLSIVIEECDESLFWLEFIRDEKIQSTENIESLINEANELTSIFVSSRKTASNKIEK